MISDLIANLTKQLYPSGRAFRMADNSLLKKLHKALAISEKTAYENSLSILDSILPDNANFTAEDATLWEKRLGLIVSPDVALNNRKFAILTKMTAPGTIKSRQHYLFIQRQLRLANFNVYVFENRFTVNGELVTKRPDEVGAFSLQDIQHGPTILHGNVNHGEGVFPKVANSIRQIDDNSFFVGENLRSTFFIGGANVGDFATVDAKRELEFRQLILRLKPVQTIAFLFVNFDANITPDFSTSDFGSDFNID